jgi:hypothetical protein
LSRNYFAFSGRASKVLVVEATDPGNGLESLMRYELWDARQNLMIGIYKTTIAALCSVFLEQQEYGRDSGRVSSLRLLARTEREYVVIGEGSALVALAIDRVNSAGCPKHELRVLTRHTAR